MLNKICNDKYNIWNRVPYTFALVPSPIRAGFRPMDKSQPQNNLLTSRRIADSSPYCFLMHMLLTLMRSENFSSDPSSTLSSTRFLGFGQKYIDSPIPVTALLLNHLNSVNTLPLRRLAHPVYDKQRSNGEASQAHPIHHDVPNFAVIKQ